MHTIMRFSTGLRSICVIFLICVFGWGSFTYAQNTGDQANLSLDIAQVIDMLTWLLSRARILLASFAGKLMTNELVYGEFINLDSLLFQFWTIMKNFANYGLGLFFIYQIVKFFWQQGNELTNITSVLGKILLAGIGIQASWFLIAATLDISTIMTIAVSSFPNIVIEQERNTQEQIINAVRSLPSRIELWLQQDADQDLLQSSESTLWDNEELSEEAILDFITPSTNSVSGPLMYVGFSALQVHKYLTISSQSPSVDQPIALITSTILKFGVVILFTIALFLLVIVNFIRVLYLWLFIVFVPILILLRVFGKEDAISKKLRWFSISRMLQLMFVPVLYIGYLGIMLIVISTLQKLIVNTTGSTGDCNTSLDGVTFCYDEAKHESSIGLDSIDSSFTLEGDIFPSGIGEDVGNMFTSITVSIFALLMLWWLVKLMSKTGGEAAGNYLENTTKLAGKAFSSVPIIPLAWWQSVSSLQRGTRAGIRKLDTDLRDQDQVNDLEQKVNKLLGFDDGVSSSELREMSILAKKDNDFVDKSSRFLRTTKEYISDIRDFQLRREKGVLQRMDTWFANNKDALAKYFRDQKNNRKVERALRNSDATTIQEFANSLRDSTTRKDFLTWMHQELGGSKDEVRTYDDFVYFPIT